MKYKKKWNTGIHFGECWCKWWQQHKISCKSLFVENGKRWCNECMFCSFSSHFSVPCRNCHPSSVMSRCLLLLGSWTRVKWQKNNDFLMFFISSIFAMTTSPNGGTQNFITIVRSSFIQTTEIQDSVDLSYRTFHYAYIFIEMPITNTHFISWKRAFYCLMCVLLRCMALNMDNGHEHDKLMFCPWGWTWHR